MSSVAPKAEPTVEQLLEQALQLPREQRLRLAEQLCDSADEVGWPTDLHPAWRDEIERRLAGLRDGTAAIVDGDEQLRRLHEKYGT